MKTLFLCLILLYITFLTFIGSIWLFCDSYQPSYVIFGAAFVLSQVMVKLS